MNNMKNQIIEIINKIKERFKNARENSINRNLKFKTDAEFINDLFYIN